MLSSIASTSIERRRAAVIAGSERQDVEEMVRRETRVNEEVRLFRAAIREWATGYARKRREIQASGRSCREAEANLAAWSREYFRGAQATCLRICEIS
jgi:hypothetical protein